MQRLTLGRWTHWALLVLALVSGVAWPADPIRIMPLGDSITQGNTEHSSWRRPLWITLKAAGFNVDFVGSQREGNGGPSPQQDFDLDHEGHWGWKASDILSKLDAWAEAAKPDIVLVHLGTNDIANGGRAPLDVVHDLERIVAVLRAHRPGVSVILAQVITTWGSLSDYNRLIPPLALRLDQPTARVVAVDQASGFSLAAGTDTFDGCHPNANGEEKMALVWLSALRPLLAAKP
ncbi:MAG: cellulose-binding protein [Planctomycetes bacterium]|nr:cellulose-binding protein [Planctomycetota bacterium]